MRSNLFLSNCRTRKAVSVLVFTATTMLPNSHATRYYVDNNTGNDINSGLSIAAPWQTLTKVNAFTFLPGDSILFVRNGIWRGQLIPKSGSSVGNITYSDYGTGEKPTLMGSVNKSLTSDWINEGGNIWRCADTFATDVGNLIFDMTASFGIKKWNQIDLLNQGDYWYDLGTGVLKIFSTANPATLYTDIECALREHIIYHQNVSYAVFNNLALKYGAAHGFGGGNTQHILIRACDISYIGGGDLDMDGSNVRFGNGIEFWANAHDNTVEQCKIWEIYDTGVSNQNHTFPVQQYNIYYQNNIIYNCALASFEYWNKPATSTTANIHFENNTCANAGYGWGTQRPNRTGAHVLLAYNEAATDSIFIRNNVFYKANASLAIPSTWNTSDGYTKLLMQNNCYFQTSALDTVVYLFFSTAYNTASFASYQSSTGLDAGSFIGDPLFVSYATNDFHVNPTSPLIDQGYPTPLVNDFDNELRSAPIDIGADEYYPTLVQENSAENIQMLVYPNPAHENIQVHIPHNTSELTLQIVDQRGATLKEVNVRERVNIQLSEFPAGTYFVRIKDQAFQPITFIKQ